MAFTTPKPQYNVEKEFPFLKGTARKTERLHPRRAKGLDPCSSKIGGTFAWPDDERPPVCPMKGCPAVPVIQLLRDEFPQLPFPRDTDLLQILWYPESYAFWRYLPELHIFWRKSETLTSVLHPVYEYHNKCFVVEECCITPETVIEYPYVGLLTAEQRQAIHEWEDEQEVRNCLYQYCLSTCPGTKIGGYPDFGGQDARKVTRENGQEFEYVLTLMDDEWDGGSYPRWRPIEQDSPPPPPHYDRWERVRGDQYRADQRALGTYLKYPLNLFVDRTAKPWQWQTA